MCPVRLFLTMIAAIILFALAYTYASGATNPISNDTVACEITHQRDAMTKELEETGVMKVKNFNDEESAKIIAVITTMNGPPPFDVNGISIIKQEGSQNKGIIFYNKGCYLGVNVLPAGIIDGILERAGVSDGFVN